MGEAVIVSVVLALAVLLLIHRSVVSTRTYGVELNLSFEEATEVVEAQFPRVSWANIQGPGTINKVHVHMMQRQLIVSVDLHPCGEATQVTAWISNRHAYGWFVFSLGALKAAQLRAKLRQRPAYLRDADQAD